MLRSASTRLVSRLTSTRQLPSLTATATTPTTSILTIPSILVSPAFNSSISDVRYMHSRSHQSEDNTSNQWWKFLIGGVATAALMCVDGKKTAETCGIVGYVGEGNAVDYLLEGLHILQNRGYDSAGVCTVRDGNMLTSKFASVGSTSDSIELLKAHAPSVHKGDHIGIAHTRWATHGGKTDENAHPHADYKDRIAVVHNGTIENYNDIKEELKALGIPFRSQTDTEVIAQLIGHYLDKGEKLTTAVKSALKRLEGTWGLAVVHKDDPHTLIAARNGSPLVVGIGEGRMFLASEVAAFSRHTNNFIALNDGEMAVIKATGVSLDLSRVQQAPAEVIDMHPDPYPHWTIKEISEQPEAIARTLGYGGRLYPDGRVKLGGLDDNSKNLLAIKHLLISGCGTSHFAGMYGALLMQSLKCFDTVSTVDSAEITDRSFPRENGGLLAVSQSGETKDTHRALKIAQANSQTSFSIVNQVGSLIARTTNCGIYLNAGREHAVASTKAFTTQVTAMALAAAWFSQNRVDGKSPMRAELMQAVHRLPIYMGMTVRNESICKEIAAKLAKTNPASMFVLGKGYAEPIAREGALKIKEITYVHAEGYSGGALKHGPFALLEPGLPVILVILDDQHAELMRIAAAEVKARGAYTIVITDQPKLAKGIADDIIPIPSNGPLTALLAVVPIQMIAYEMSVMKGINPDKPRNLAKAVTVD